MTFANPWLLLLLALIPLLAWLKGRRGGQPAFLYSSVQLVKGILDLNRSSVGAMLLRLRWLALALFIIALARPQLGEGEQKVTASGIDIVLALDLSGSMASEEFELHGQPANRLAVAKDVIEQFVAKRTSDRIGLVAFAGRAYIATPLTLDHDFLLQNLNRLNLGTIEDGTAIGSGLATSVDRLRSSKSKSKVIILLTDGENNGGQIPPLTAKELAKATGVKVYTIGVGTEGFAQTPMQTQTGAVVMQREKVNIDEKLLTQIATETGGRYFRAKDNESLRNIYTEIDKLEKSRIEVTALKRYSEKFFPFAIAALALLLTEMVLQFTLFKKFP